MEVSLDCNGVAITLRERNAANFIEIPWVLSAAQVNGGYSVDVKKYSLHIGYSLCYALRKELKKSLTDCT